MHVLTNMFQFKLGSAEPDADFEQDDSDEETSQAGSKRKRSTRKTAASSRASKGAIAPISSALPRSSAAPIYLRSAWKPKVFTTRPSVQTIPCRFIRTTAAFDSNACRVEMQVQSDIKETIDVAVAWEQGQDGYIGTGFTKRGIYVCSLTYSSRMPI